MAKLWQDLRDHLAGKYPGELICIAPDRYDAHTGYEFECRQRIPGLQDAVQDFVRAWNSGYSHALATNAQRDRDEGWILCSERLPPYDEVVWLTLQVAEQLGKKLPFKELAWRVERGERHATNKHGEIWWRAGISGEMAWEVFSWTRSAQPALDARAGK